jgi:hypothetical protein
MSLCLRTGNIIIFRKSLPQPVRSQLQCPDGLMPVSTVPSDPTIMSVLVVQGFSSAVGSLSASLVIRCQLLTNPDVRLSSLRTSLFGRNLNGFSPVHTFRAFLLPKLLSATLRGRTKAVSVRWVKPRTHMIRCRLKRQLNFIDTQIRIACKLLYCINT